MRVDHLRDLLAALPDETAVLVNSFHVEFIHREAGWTRWPVRKKPAPTCGKCGQTLDHEREWVEAPPSITLGSTITPVRRTSPDPPVTFSGRWRKASREVIDRYSDDPDAEDDE